MATGVPWVPEELVVDHENESDWKEALVGPLSYVGVGLVEIIALVLVEIEVKV